jgi:hypothetical protein
MWWMLVPTVAHALDPVWSVGGHVGTNFLPNAYPLGFPPKIRSYDFDEDEQGVADDVDGDGTPDATSIEKVTADVTLGIDAAYWAMGKHRLLLSANADVGGRYSEFSMLGLYNRCFDLQTLYVLAGGGFGFSSATWRGTDEDERLRLPNYPLRAEGGILLPVSDFLGLEGKLYAQMAIPARHHYTDIAGHEQDIAGVPFTYTTVGIQIGGVYGLLR